MEAGTLSALFIAVASLVGWLVTQTQANNRTQRQELRGRRSRDQLKDRYISRLESSHAIRDLPLPEKPEGLEEAEKEEW